MVQVEDTAVLTTERNAPRGAGAGAHRVCFTVTGSPERSTKWALCVQDLYRQSQIRRANKGERGAAPVTLANNL